jgi:hypothetical protein
MFHPSIQQYRGLVLRYSITGREYVRSFTGAMPGDLLVSLFDVPKLVWVNQLQRWAANEFARLVAQEIVDGFTAEYPARFLRKIDDADWRMRSTVSMQRRAEPVRRCSGYLLNETQGESDMSVADGGGGTEQGIDSGRGDVSIVVLCAVREKGAIRRCVVGACGDGGAG